MRGRTLKEHIGEKMKNPEFKRAWQELDAEFSILEGVIKARKKARLTQQGFGVRLAILRFIVELAGVSGLHSCVASEG
jgi:hypothetical protein